MIVDDFDLVALPFAPDEADAPLVVDPDAVLACALSSQSLQAILRQPASEASKSVLVHTRQWARNLLQRLPLGCHSKSQGNRGRNQHQQRT